MAQNGGVKISSSTRYVSEDTLITCEDGVINVDTSGNAVTLYLPNIDGAGIMGSPQMFMINDVGNNASVNNIIVAGVGADKINGGSAVMMKVNNGTAQCQPCSNTDWLVNMSTDSDSVLTLYYAVTKNALDILISNNLLVPGATYIITDRGDLGLIFTAVTGNKIADNGTRLMLCPMTYEAGDVDGDTSIGVWNPTKSVSASNIAIWGGLFWINLTGAIGTADSDIALDATNWYVAPKVATSSYYTQLQFGCQFDVANDWISKQWDENGNVFGAPFTQSGTAQTDYCSISDWNWATSGHAFHNNVCYGIFNNSNASKMIENTNAGVIKNNYNNGEIIENSNQGNISSNTDTAGSIWGNSNKGNINDNSFVSDGISGNSNNGNVSSNSNTGVISNNSNNGSIESNTINITNINDNSNNGSISNNRNSGNINNNSNIGFINGNGNGSNVVNIQFNSNHGYISANYNVGNIEYNSNLGTIRHNFNSGSIDHNSNDGDISANDVD